MGSSRMGLSIFPDSLQQNDGEMGVRPKETPGTYLSAVPKKCRLGFSPMVTLFPADSTIPNITSW